MLSPHSRGNNENRPRGSHGYQLTRRQTDRSASIENRMATADPKNAASTGLDSKWTPQRHFCSVG
jgi:hypothetical protein